MEPCGNDTCVDVNEMIYLRSRNETLKAVEKWLGEELEADTELAKSPHRDIGHLSALLELKTVIYGDRP